MKHKIFVYGSLMRGFGNHPLLEDCEFLGKVLTEPRFTMLHLGGFPGIIEVGDTAIKGELYSIDEDVLDRLDHLEGHPHFYQRKPLMVILDSGKEWVEAYILPAEWSEEIYAAIPSGNWGERGQ